MSSPEEQSDPGGQRMNSAAEKYAHLTLTKSNDFQPAWDCLISRIANQDSGGVKQWCETWGNIPETTQTQLMENRSSPMCVAAEIGSVDIIEILVKYGFSPNRQEKHGNQLDAFVPIHDAARKGHLDVVKKLVEDFSVPVDTKNRCGWTTLMWAVKSNHTSIVKYLLTKGADANYIRHDPRRINMSPLFLSVIKRSTDNACLLLDSGADVNLRVSKAGSVLNRAVARRYLDMVKLLCNRGAKLDVLDEQGQGIMHLALGPRPRPSIALIRYLIDLNVSLDVVSEDGYTPLCHGLSSAADGELLLEWAPLLLDAGHQLSRQDYNSVRDHIAFSSDQLVKIDDMVEKYLSVPRTLLQLCCFRIRRIFGFRLPRCIECLPLPSVLKGYISLKYLQPPILTKTQEMSEHSQAPLEVASLRDCR